MRRKVIRKKREKKPAVAAFLSLVFWGSGQFYNGQFLKGCLFMFTNILILPWMYSIFDAYVTCQRHNHGDLKKAEPRRWYVALLVWFIMACFTVYMLLWAWAWLKEQTRQDHNLLAQNYLLEISVGSEHYARDNNGEYPLEISDLLEAKPPYARRDLCDKYYAGFVYACYFTPMGYRVEAYPVKTPASGELREHAIITGGVYTEPLGLKK